jgi:hypothetical protein
MAMRERILEIANQLMTAEKVWWPGAGERGWLFNSTQCAIEPRERSFACEWAVTGTVANEVRFCDLA